MNTTKKVRVIVAVSFTLLMAGVLVSSYLRHQEDEDDYTDNLPGNLAERVREQYNIPDATRTNEFIKLRKTGSQRYSIEDESGLFL